MFSYNLNSYKNNENDGDEIIRAVNHPHYHHESEMMESESESEFD
jgi:hypothetical protein